MSGAGRRRDGAVPDEYVQLERAVHTLMDHHAAWQRRARTAERKVAELQATVKRLSSGGLDPMELQRRADALADENARLKERMAQAHDRVRKLVDRFEFLKEER